MSTPSGFDLGSAPATIEREDEGQVVHLNDEAGEPMYFGDNEPVTVTVTGTYSKRYRRALDAKMARSRKRRTVDIDEVRRDALEVNAQCVIEWSGFFDSGTPLDCTKANVVKVLEAAPWIKDQIEAAMEDHAGFSRASSLD